MEKHIKRAAIIGAGYLLLLVGIVGLVLPVLQGVLFIAVGLAVLSRETVWARRLLGRLQTRYPGLAAKAQEWEQRVMEWWRR